MKPGIAVSTFPAQFGPIVLTGDDLKGNLVLAKKLGYEGIDLFVNQKTDAEIEEIGVLFETLGLNVSMFVAIFLAEKGVNFSDIDEQNRKQSVREYKEQIVIAHKLKAKTMPVGFVRGNMPKGGNETDYLNRLANSLSELVEFAADKDIDICLEPINRYEINTIQRLDQALDLIETFRIDGLKVLPDFFHMNIEEVSMHNALTMAGNRIGHIHVPDSNRLAPGQGHLDFPALLSALKETGYNGYLTVEALPKPSGCECAGQGAAFLIDALHNLERE